MTLRLPWGFFSLGQGRLLQCLLCPAGVLLPLEVDWEAILGPRVPLARGSQDPHAICTGQERSLGLPPPLTAAELQLSRIVSAWATQRPRERLLGLWAHPGPSCSGSWGKGPVGQCLQPRTGFLQSSFLWSTPQTWWLPGSMDTPLPVPHRAGTLAMPLVLVVSLELSRLHQPWGLLLTSWQREVHFPGATVPCPFNPLSIPPQEGTVQGSCIWQIPCPVDASALLQKWPPCPFPSPHPKMSLLALY